MVGAVALEAFEVAGANHVHLRQGRHSKVFKSLRSFTHVAAYCRHVGRPATRETVLDVNICRMALNNLAQTHLNTSVVSLYLNNLVVALTGETVIKQQRKPKE